MSELDQLNYAAQRKEASDLRHLGYKILARLTWIAAWLIIIGFFYVLSFFIHRKP